jgi:hypothetical protein
MHCTGAASPSSRVRRGLSVSLLLFSCVGTGTSVDAQTARLPTWSLAEPRLLVGDAEIELDRVRAGAFLRDGNLVIADGGNRRVLVVSPTGALLRQFGKSGSGPGDFQALSVMATAGDTIAIYDGFLARVSLWRADGRFLRTVSLPIVGGQQVVVRAIVSPFEYIVTTRTVHTGDPTGLYHDSATVLRLNGATGVTTKIATHEWELSYHYVQGAASSTYRTPFLGQTLLAANAERILTVPLGTSIATITRPNGSVGASVTLPITRRPFDRSLVDAYRDSLLSEARKSGSGAMVTDRIQAVFGKTFPVPANRPIVDAAQLIGADVWLREASADPRSLITWYVISLAKEQLVATLQLPRSWRPLAGDGKRVCVLKRDELDVESSVLYNVRR